MDKNTLGSKTWIIADGYLPPREPREDLVSHEAVCILNAGNEPADVVLEVYFEDRDPLTDISFRVDARRCWHLRLDKLKEICGVSIPEGVPYALRLVSNKPVVVQHSRLDVTQPNLALFTSIAHPLD